MQTAARNTSVFKKRWLPGSLPLSVPVGVGNGPIQGSTDPVFAKVEIFVNNSWEDITSFVYYRNGTGRITISRGRANETSKYQPQTCTFELNNRDGRFSPKNPTGPYYGQIGRNTQVRISRMWNGYRWYRFYGDIPSWPNDADISGRDVFIKVQANGRMRRLSQGNPPVQSAMYRMHMLNPVVTNLVAYWPFEDGSNSGVIGTPVDGAMPMEIFNTPTLSSNSGFVCSSPLPVMNKGSFYGTIPVAPSWQSNTVRFLLQVPAAGDTNNAIVLTYYTTGTVYKVQVVYQSGSNGSLVMLGYNVAGTQVFTTGNFQPNGVGVNGKLLMVSATLKPSGSSIIFELESLEVGQSIVYGFSSTLASSSINAVTSVIVGTGNNLVGSAIGHVSVQSVRDPLQDYIDPLNAYLGEDPQHRFGRLCNENGASYEINYASFIENNTTTMGYQTPGAFLDLLQETVDTNMDFLYEAKDQQAFSVRTRISLYNQPVQLSFDLSTTTMSAQPVPQGDDIYTVNDITVSRKGGSSSRQNLKSGELSVLDPPNGVGLYQSSNSYSLGSDSQVQDHAGWRLHVGTSGDFRFPSISVNARHPTYTTNPPLMNTLLAADIGTHIRMFNTRPSIGYDFIDVIIQGYQESLGEWEHDFVFNCSPQNIYNIAVLDDPVLSVADTDGSTLTGTLSANLSPNPLFTAATGNPIVGSGSLNGWAVKNGSIASVGGDSGTLMPTNAGSVWGALLTPNGAGQSLLWQGDNTVTASRFAVSPGAQYRATAIANSPGGYANVQIGIDWWDSTGTYISTTPTIFSLSASSWTAIHTVGNAPANAATGSINVGENSIAGVPPSSSNTLYVINAYVYTGALTVATTGASSGSPLWTTNAIDFPFDINIAGERITVTSISGTSSPQTFGVSRSANGVIKPQVPGTDVRLWQPMILSL